VLKILPNLGTAVARFFRGDAFPLDDAKSAASEKAAEKVGYFVIPSEARDLLLRKCRKKQIPRANPALGMTILVIFGSL
jgi:hypothetical protein